MVVSRRVPIVPPKILALDLETSPNVADVWGLFDQHVGLSQLKESTRVICWGGRWLGDTQVHFRSEFHDGRERMLADLWESLDRADAVMGWNSKSFDVKHCNREFLENGLGPPSPFVHMDLMLEWKRNFRTPSNKLQYASTLLGFEGKVQHEGHALWVKCLQGDPDAWDRMREYQIQDVNLLIDMYEKLQPWLKAHPHHGLYTDEDKDVCQRCGSTDLVKRGFAYTSLASFQQYRCRNCRSWSRGAKALKRVDARAAA